MRHRILALSILCALALQMELPVAHAPAHPDGDSRAALAQGAASHELQPGASHAREHDPASCPICQSLHAKPAAPLAALAQRRPSERSVALYTPAQRPNACAVLTGHPPRAPPHPAHTLA